MNAIAVTAPLRGAGCASSRGGGSAELHRRAAIAQEPPPARLRAGPPPAGGPWREPGHRGALRLGALLVLLTGASACQSAPEAADPVEAPAAQPGVDVTRVEAYVVLDPEALSIRARATLTVRHPHALRHLTLGLDDALALRSVHVDGRPVEATRQGDALLIPLVPGTNTSDVRVSYRGTPAAGLYADEAAGGRVVFTDGWPDRTAGWLPAVHAPADPFALDLTVVVPEALRVVASGETVLDTVAGGLRTVRSVLPQGAPAYTAAFAVGDYVFTRDASGTVPVRTALLRGDADRGAAFARLPAAIDTLAAILGPYPYATFTTVEAPIAYLGMENAAAPFLSAALYRTAPRGPGSLEETALHELVHQWWGNRVPPASWRDLWLAEGPATYLTADLLGRLDGGDDGLRHLALVARNTAPADARRRLVPHALSRPEDALSIAVYTKGAAAMHVIRLTVGERAFWQALREIQTAGRPVSTADFQRAFERTSGRDLGPLFAYWTAGTDVPRLETTWNRRTRRLSWTLGNDGGTLHGIPFQLLVRQGSAERVVLASDGGVTMPGTDRPDVWPVGVYLDTE